MLRSQYSNSCDCWDSSNGCVEYSRFLALEFKLAAKLHYIITVFASKGIALGINKQVLLICPVNLYLL
jgi:hypothetical protein